MILSLNKLLIYVELFLCIWYNVFAAISVNELIVFNTDNEYSVKNDCTDHDAYSAELKGDQL